MSDFLQNHVPFLHKKKPWYKNAKIVIPVVALLALAVGVSAAIWRNNSGEEAPEKTTAFKPAVQTVLLDETKGESDEVRASGVVKADSQVDVVALANGTVRNLYFNIGDVVRVNQLLANLYDQTLLTNLNNAQVQYDNTQQSYNSLQRLTDESVKQQEQGVRNAEQAIVAAQDNYDNAKNVQETSKVDAFSNAVVSYAGYVNTVRSTLDQIDYLIDADDGEGSQLSGIAATLSIKNSDALFYTENAYLTAKNRLRQLEGKAPTTSTISKDLTEIVGVLGQTKDVVDKTITVLDNTITSPAFPESSLIAQKNTLTGLRATVVSAQNSAQSTAQGLQNIDIINKRELDTLQNAVTAAQNQLLQARSALDNAKASKEQQLVGVQNSLNTSQGQLNTVNSQLADLSVAAPISGTITKKYVELGAELSPGQKIAEISQTDLVKVMIEVTSDDVYKLAIGQEALINGALTGAISRIDPAADSLSKKVGVNIAYDNRNKDLIAETFVDVVIKVDKHNGVDFVAGTFFVPLKAVTITQTEQYVFIIQNGKAVKTSVTIGATREDTIEIVSGLQNGDEVIVEGNRLLAGGEEVEVTTNNAL